MRHLVMKILHCHTSGKWIQLQENGRVTIPQYQTFQNRRNHKLSNAVVLLLLLTNKGMFPHPAILSCLLSLPGV